LLKNKFDCEVIRAITGKDVIERIKERKDINLILLDIRLPIMDGFTAFGEVKKINPSVPIIAVTAYAYAEDRKKIMEMGFDDYVAKPFDLKELISKINKILKEKHPETS
jgi:DNA-binding response OmpR family regulator